MLAYKVDSKPVDWTNKVYMQPKLDGVRCLIQLNDKGEVYAYSRTGKPWLNIAHILEDLEYFFEIHPDVVLDGELYNHDLRNNFEKIISLVRKQKPTDQQRLEAKELVQFHCYDYVETVMNESYSYRKDKLCTSDMYTDSVHYVPTYLVSSYEEAQELHFQNVSVKDYEGSILRLDTPYQCKRSYSLQKFKDFHDTEATIIGYVDGKGKREGTLGKFLMQDDDGVEFGGPPGKGYNYKMLAEMLTNIHNYIGKRATFTYFERTKAGSYRHPLFKTLRNYE